MNNGLKERNHETQTKEANGIGGHSSKNQMRIKKHFVNK